MSVGKGLGGALGVRAHGGSYRWGHGGPVSGFIGLRLAVEGRYERRQSGGTESWRIRGGSIRVVDVRSG